MKEEPSLLNEVYETLDYQSGDLVDIASYTETISIDNYIAKGQWLDTCRAINQRAEFKVDKLFFVQDNPIVVFVDATGVERKRIFSVYNEVWSLARPRLVFIENDISITVYDLASSPAKSNHDLKPLTSFVNESRQILGTLRAFDRAGIESGAVFGDKRFSTVNQRADLSLINDLKQARKKLFENGLDGEKLKYAHALIGRSIFIRYLEDRGVLTKEYFLKVAQSNSNWRHLIETPLDVNFYRHEMRDLIYPRLLSDKELTYSLFKQIAEDFNGDTFTSDISEEMVVEQKHLNLLQNFLLGEGNSPQLPLYLWAYRFDVIPIDLISSIYEEFYHSKNLIDNKTKKLKDGKGTHYTPSSLVEFVLSRTLTLEVLKVKPRVLDPACGSGIFLVESFRRMVRHQIAAGGRDRLTVDELLAILKNQIAGIEINGEAIKIAAFSLYLSLLHYLNPPSILDYIKSGRKLPYLIWHDKEDDNHFNILLKANSFNEERTSKVFESNSFDVIVGNPPWGTPSTKDTEGRRSLEKIEKWCVHRKIEFPDKEPSHAFLFRSIDFLKPSGISSLLVSSGVLLKFSDPSNSFKDQLISNFLIKEVINFAHVRRVFFPEAISPFLLIQLVKHSPNLASKVRYISLRKTATIDKNRVAIIEAKDFKLIPYSQATSKDIWKIIYWGNEYDFKLINSIRRFPSLKEYADSDNCAQGFKKANESKPADWLTAYQEMPTKYFNNKYSQFNLKDEKDVRKLLAVPSFVEARGKEGLYNGKRILIKRGIDQRYLSPKGQVVCRIETDRFAFRNSIHCIKLSADAPVDYSIVIGILWSSLFRYYMFMTASNFGIWHDEVHLNEVMEFPIANYDKEVVEKLEKVVREIRQVYSQSDKELIQPDINHLEEKLDCLVFDMYRLTDFERTLIMDRCDYDIDYYYNGLKSVACKAARKPEELTDYISSFKSHWARSLEEHEFFESRVLFSRNGAMLGLIFNLRSSQRDSEESQFESEIPEIQDFDDLLIHEVSSSVFTEGVFRRVSDNYILIIKRNQKINWTLTEAKMDADSTLLSALGD
jgi:type I restriction-modification system DNA methylase subunit